VDDIDIDIYYTCIKLVIHIMFPCIIGFYVDGFPKLNRFIEHHDKIMNKFLPKLKRKMDKCGCDSILYALKWFFVVFQERVSYLFFFDIYVFLTGYNISLFCFLSSFYM